MGILKRLGKKRWSPAFDLMLEHSNATVKVVEDLRDAVRFKTEGRNDQAVERIRSIEMLEKGADELTREIMMRLTDGVFPPLSRQDLVHLARRLDDITDHAHKAARYLMWTDLASFPTSVRDGLVQLSEETLKCMAKTSEVIIELEKDFEESWKKCVDVEILEAVCDKLYQDLTGQLPKIEGGNPGMMILLHDLITSMQQISDLCEDAIDLVRVIILRASGL